LQAKKQPLRFIGSGALMLQSDYDRGTKDSDILQTVDLDAETCAQLLELADRDTEVFTRHRLYIDVVKNGVPFLARAPRWHAHSQLSTCLQHFDVYVLDVADVVVSKLKRFHANDQRDILAMVDRNLLRHEELIARFQAAMDIWQDGAQAVELPRYIANLNAVERDMLFVTESEFELPSWVDDR
jgi:hypothetical protein